MGACSPLLIWEDAAQTHWWGPGSSSQDWATCNSDGGGCSFVFDWSKSHHPSTALEESSGRCFLVNYGASLSTLQHQTLGLSNVCFGCSFCSSLYKREDKAGEQEKKKRVGSRVGSCLISVLCFKQVWRDLSVCLQLHCVGQAHCSSLKERFGGFLSGDLLLLVLSTHHVWSVHNFELRDVAGISRNHNTSRTRGQNTQDHRF